ncbi:hypothetical protein H3C61_02910 [Candidatus Gracilibacteria bacterium]|nr:hypothetical protein [Candidatus Gracilibacteria bacterium]
MNKLKYIFFGILLSNHAKIFAGDAGILGGVDQEKIRKGNIHTDDIPKIISYAIDYLLGFAATISIVFIIIGAYKIAIGSIDGDKSEGKKTIMLAIGGFVLASLSWLILKLVIDNFS